MLSMLLLTTMIVGVCVDAAGDVAAETYIGLFNGKLHNDISKYFSSSVVALPDTVKDDQIISLIIEVDAESLLDAYEASDKAMSISEFAESDEAAALRENIAKENAELIEKLDKAGYSYELGLDYDTVIAGFELLITARDFEDVCRTLGRRTNVIVGDVYKSMENQLVVVVPACQCCEVLTSLGQYVSKELDLDIAAVTHMDDHDLLTLSGCGKIEHGLLFNLQLLAAAGKSCTQHHCTDACRKNSFLHTIPLSHISYIV